MSRFRLAMAVACVVAVLSGCGGATNDGGDTTCKDFLAMSKDDQEATVAKLLKERNGRNSSTQDVINTKLRLRDSCESGKPDVKISELG